MLLVKPFYLKHQAKKVGDSSSNALMEHHDDEEEGEGTNVVGGGHGGGHGHGDHVSEIDISSVIIFAISMTLCTVA